MQGKVIIITGASSGIGLACAEILAQRGACLVLAARRLDVLSGLASRLTAQYGAKVLVVQTDVSEPEACQNLVMQAMRKFNRIDVLINNAGISMRALFKDVQLSVLHRLMDVNFWGAVYCTHYALPELLKNQGSVVAVSSIAGYKGLPGRSAYSASKFAMQGFFDSLRIEHLPEKLHVLVACPGFTASNIRHVALNKDGLAQQESTLNESNMHSAQSVAKAIADAITRKKRDLVLTGLGKFTVWMSRFFPGLTDRLVYKRFAKEQ